jgi:hypothetical protein
MKSSNFERSECFNPMIITQYLFRYTFLRQNEYCSSSFRTRFISAVISRHAKGVESTHIN